MTGKPFTLLVDIPLKPGRADEFMALLNDVFEAMKVEETFISATALRRAEDPDTVLLCENWIDPDNFSSVRRQHSFLGSRLRQMNQCRSFETSQIIFIQSDGSRFRAQ